MNLPTLYKKTSTGAIQTWHIDVEGSTIIATYGQQGGKLQTARDTITAGKNIGRSNETTAAEQAELEAAAQWEKKSKKGYVQNVADAADGTVDAEFIAGGIYPMLAHPFAEHGAKIVFPAFTQPKLDGHRCVAMKVDGAWTLWSRTRKPITGVPHILKALDAADLDGDVTLDGELYNHDYRDRFEQLTSFIRRPDPKPGHEVVQYHVYDLVPSGESAGQGFDRRQMHAHAIVTTVDDPSVVFVDTVLVDDEAAAAEAFAGFIDAGYEGAMLRNMDSPYVQKRSYDLQKMKEFDDAEFEIINVEEGRGKLAGKGIFVCATADGTEFSVKLKGSLDDLGLDVLRQNIGDGLTVQYQGLTGYGVPRFPVGLRIRKDI